MSSRNILPAYINHRLSDVNFPFLILFPLPMRKVISFLDKIDTTIQHMRFWRYATSYRVFWRVKFLFSKYLKITLNKTKHCHELLNYRVLEYPFESSISFDHLLLLCKWVGILNIFGSVIDLRWQGRNRWQTRFYSNFAPLKIWNEYD